MSAGSMIRVIQKGLLAWKILLAGFPSSLAVIAREGQAARWSMR